MYQSHTARRNSNTPRNMNAKLIARTYRIVSKSSSFSMCVQCVQLWLPLSESKMNFGAVCSWFVATFCGMGRCWPPPSSWLSSHSHTPNTPNTHPVDLNRAECSNEDGTQAGRSTYYIAVQFRKRVINPHSNEKKIKKNALLVPLLEYKLYI